jgi:hypothetical protein
MGSNGLDSGSPAGLAVDPAGDIYLAGNTVGPNLITTPGAFMTADNSGGCCSGKGFVAGIAAQATARLAFTSSQAGPTVTLTAVVSPSQNYASMPTGTITFLNGDSTLFSTNLDATGKASYSSATVPAGTYTLTAQYSGDSTYPAVSTNAVVTVNPLP